MYGYLEIIGWLWHGILQLIRVVVPVLQPARETGSAPPWFSEVYPEWLWDYYLDANDRPTETWCHNYIYAARVQQQKWIEYHLDKARDAAVDVVRGFTGWVGHGYSTFAAWIEAIRARVGAWIPWWADNLADAAQKLWLKLPDAIRYATATWDDLWESIKESVREWVRDTYDAVVALGRTAYEWVVNTGVTLKVWWNAAHAWLDDFRQNAAARVQNWLGTTWTRLRTFERDCLSFWYDLWGANAQEIGGLLSRPLEWLYERIDAFLSEKWG